MYYTVNWLVTRYGLDQPYFEVTWKAPKSGHISVYYAKFEVSNDKPE